MRKCVFGVLVLVLAVGEGLKTTSLGNLVHNGRGIEIVEGKVEKGNKGGTTNAERRWDTFLYSIFEYTEEIRSSCTLLASRESMHEIFPERGCLLRELLMLNADGNEALVDLTAPRLGAELAGLAYARSDAGRFGKDVAMLSRLVQRTVRMSTMYIASENSYLKELLVEMDVVAETDANRIQCVLRDEEASLTRAVSQRLDPILRRVGEFVREAQYAAKEAQQVQDSMQQRLTLILHNKGVELTADSLARGFVPSIESNGPVTRSLRLLSRVQTFLSFAVDSLPSRAAHLTKITEHTARIAAATRSFQASTCTPPDNSEESTLASQLAFHLNTSTTSPKALAVALRTFAKSHLLD